MDSNRSCELLIKWTHVCICIYVQGIGFLLMLRKLKCWGKHWNAIQHSLHWILEVWNALDIVLIVEMHIDTHIHYYVCADNEIGAEEIKLLGEALKCNASITTLSLDSMKHILYFMIYYYIDWFIYSLCVYRKCYWWWRG